MSADLFQTFGLAEMRNLAVSDCIIGLISELMSGQRRTLRLMSLLCNGMLHVWNARSISLNSSSRETEYFSQSITTCDTVSGALPQLHVGEICALGRMRCILALRRE